MSLSIFLTIIFFIGAALSWLLSFWSRRLSVQVNAIDQPKGGRKVHQKPTPLLGGVGIVVTILVLTIIGMHFSWFASTQIRPMQLWGFLAALVLLLLVGCADDCWDISVRIRFIAYILACVLIVVSGTSIHLITNWVGVVPVALGRWTGDALTLVWMLSVLYTTKFLDGLDGLVAGQTVIGAGLIVFLTLSAAFFQPSVAILAMIVLAAYAGILPVNMDPARLFLGESGSVIAGFSLGFLSIVSGAKLATAFMAIGIPLADAAIVIIARCLRGTSPFRGDDTHLHFKLVRFGLSKRHVVMLYWCLALGAGILAFGLQTRGKFLLMVGLLIGTATLSWFAGTRTRSSKS